MPSTAADLHAQHPAVKIDGLLKVTGVDGDKIYLHSFILSQIIIEEEMLAVKAVIK